MEQGFVLSSIFSTLYIISFIHIFELRAQALNLNTSIILFINDSFLISYGKTYYTTLLELYREVTDLIILFGLIIEHNKSEIFYFSRVHNNSNLLSNWYSYPQA